jgi:hypothetical protein
MSAEHQRRKVYLLLCIQEIPGLSLTLENVHFEGGLSWLSSSSLLENVYTPLQPPYKSSDRTMAQTVRSRPLTAEARFNAGSVCVEFVVAIWALG